MTCGTDFGAREVVTAPAFGGSHTNGIRINVPDTKMTLTNEARLFIDGASETVEFRFESFDVTSSELSKDLLIGGDAGQLTDEVLDWVGLSDGANAAGYAFDAGLGQDTIQLRIEVDPGDVGSPWGPVRGKGGDPKVEDIDGFAAHGESPWTRAQVLKWWLRNERIDSIDPDSVSFEPAEGSGELHIRDWTDGTYSVDAGKFGEPISITPLSVEHSVSRDDPSRRQIDLTLLRVDDLAIGGVTSILPTP